MPNEPSHSLIDLAIDIDQVKRFERIIRRRDRAHSQQPKRAEIPLLTDRAAGRHEGSSCQSALINNLHNPTSGTRLSAIRSMDPGRRTPRTRTCAAHRQPR
jgi:hypothetical protein